MCQRSFPFCFGVDVHRRAFDRHLKRAAIYHNQAEPSQAKPSLEQTRNFRTLGPTQIIIQSHHESYLENFGCMKEPQGSHNKIASCVHNYIRRGVKHFTTNQNANFRCLFELHFCTFRRIKHLNATKSGRNQIYCFIWVQRKEVKGC